MPRSVVGASDPKLNGQKCFGFLIATNESQALAESENRIQLKWLLKAYTLFPGKNEFFNDRFALLAGSHKLRLAIESGLSEEEIRKGWAPGLANFLKIRERHLLYPDFTEGDASPC